MNKKITKRERFMELLAITEVAENEALVEFIEHELELLAKKNNAGVKKPTKVQLENEELKELIWSVLSDVHDYLSIAEIQKCNETLAALSNQKMSALMKQLVDGNRVVRSQDKKAVKFAVIEILLEKHEVFIREV